MAIYGTRYKETNEDKKARKGVDEWPQARLGERRKRDCERVKGKGYLYLWELAEFCLRQAGGMDYE